MISVFSSKEKKIQHAFVQNLWISDVSDHVHQLGGERIYLLMQMTAVKPFCLATNRRYCIPWSADVSNKCLDRSMVSLILLDVRGARVSGKNEDQDEQDSSVACQCGNRREGRMLKELICGTGRQHKKWQCFAWAHWILWWAMGGIFNPGGQKKSEIVIDEFQFAVFKYRSS